VYEVRQLEKAGMIIVRQYMGGRPWRKFYVSNPDKVNFWKKFENKTVGLTIGIMTTIEVRKQ